MELIIIIVIVVVTIIVNSIMKINIKKLKEIALDTELNEITKKYPNNKEICNKILTMIGNNKTKIEENIKSEATIYIVSIRTNCVSPRAMMPVMRLRVVCGLLETMATFSPTSALVSVLLPTLGRPAMVIMAFFCIYSLSVAGPPRSRAIIASSRARMARFISPSSMWS